VAEEGREGWEEEKVVVFSPDPRASGHLHGMVAHLIPWGGVTHLQYADDIMIMVEGSDLDIVNLKFLLLCFEEMSGLKINFDKRRWSSWDILMLSSSGSQTT
jgi:hypothetical protein